MNKNRRLSKKPDHDPKKIRPIIRMIGRPKRKTGRYSRTMDSVNDMVLNGWDIQPDEDHYGPGFGHPMPSGWAGLSACSRPVARSFRLALFLAATDATLPRRAS